MSRYQAPKSSPRAVICVLNHKAGLAVAGAGVCRAHVRLAALNFFHMTLMVPNAGCLHAETMPGGVTV